MAGPRSTVLAGEPRTGDGNGHNREVWFDSARVALVAAILLVICRRLFLKIGGIDLAAVAGRLVLPRNLLV
jgi:hypothetical protein